MVTVISQARHLLPFVAKQEFGEVCPSAVFVYVGDDVGVQVVVNYFH